MSSTLSAAEPPKRIRTAVIGCGSVSGQYLPVLTKCPYVEVVSVCDIKPARAKKHRASTAAKAKRAAAKVVTDTPAPEVVVAADADTKSPAAVNPAAKALAHSA